MGRQSGNPLRRLVNSRIRDLCARAPAPTSAFACTRSGWAGHAVEGSELRAQSAGDPER